MRERAIALPNAPTCQQLCEVLGSKLIEAVEGELARCQKDQAQASSHVTRLTGLLGSTFSSFSILPFWSGELLEKAEPATHLW